MGYEAIRWSEDEEKLQDAVLSETRRTLDSGEQSPAEIAKYCAHTIVCNQNNPAGDVFIGRMKSLLANKGYDEKELQSLVDELS